MGEGIESVVGNSEGQYHHMLHFVKKAAMCAFLSYVALNFTSCFNQPKDDPRCHKYIHHKLQHVYNCDYESSQK